MMTKLDKRDVLNKIGNLGMKLRIKPDDFISIEGEPDMDAASVRLNRCGKCLESMTYLIIYCKDGEELSKDGCVAYDNFIRYLNECYDAFDIGRKSDGGK